MADRDTPDGEGEPKAKSPYKEGNTGPDGSYLVGKYLPPEHGKFRVNDGRKRGKRAKGTANLETDFLAEARTKITVDEGGKKVRITKQQAAVKKLFDRGFKGDVSALREMFAQLRTIADRQAQRADRNLGANDREIIDAYFDDMMRGLQDGSAHASVDDKREDGDAE